MDAVINCIQNYQDHSLPGANSKKKERKQRKRKYLLFLCCGQFKARKTLAKIAWVTKLLIVTLSTVFSVGTINILYLLSFQILVIPMHHEGIVRMLYELFFAPLSFRKYAIFFLLFIFIFSLIPSKLFFL